MNFSMITQFIKPLFINPLSEGGPVFMYPTLILLIICIALIAKGLLKGDADNKLQKLITTELIDLVELSQSKLKNSYSRALCFQLYEKNGVMKRESINEVLKNDKDS